MLVAEAQLFGCLCRLHDLASKDELPPGEPGETESDRVKLEAKVTVLGGDVIGVRRRVAAMHAERLAEAKRRSTAGI